MKTLAMIRYTLQEYLHGIGLIVLLLAFVVVFLFYGVALSIEGADTGEKVLLLGQDPFKSVDMSDPVFREFARLGAAELLQFGLVIAAVGWGSIFFIIIGSRIMDSILSQGNRHLLLSKPMHRGHILLGRLGGFMLFSAIVLYLFLGGSWLIIGLKTGCFLYQPFAAAPIILLIYLSFISVVALISVLVDNFFVAAGVTVAFYIVTIVLDKVGEVIADNPALHFGWTVLHTVLPRVNELSAVVCGLYLPNLQVGWVNPVWTTLVFCAVVIGAGAFIFTRKDY